MTPGMAYTRAEISQVDAWETLGNAGWNWSALWPYYLKSETFQKPDAARLSAGHLAYDAEDHGDSGPLYTAWPYDETNDTYPIKLNETYQSLNVPWNEDGTGGSMVGFSPYLKTLNQDLNVRWDAARAYYFPYEDRTNLKVLLNTFANKLTWASTNDTDATASGVEITSADGTTSVVKARKEVILSAGSLVSPQILELSGVGNPDILSKFDIETVIDLPTVGENLQDQLNNELVYEPPSNFTSSYDNGGGLFVAYPSASQILGSNESSVAEDLKSQLSAYAEAVAAENGNVTKASDLLEFFQIQYDLIFMNEVPYAEVLIYVSEGVWGGQYWGLLPFSRGSVHISETNSTTKPTINPRYFMVDYDIELQVSTAKFMRDVFSTGPFASVAGTETSPGYDALPTDASFEAWTSWVFDGYRSNFHPVATAAMMPKEKGGVVDTELKVYGTTNVRVVDASIMPFQVCGHLVSTLYAIAERASDMIKASA